MKNDITYNRKFHFQMINVLSVPQQCLTFKVTITVYMKLAIFISGSKFIVLCHLYPLHHILFSLQSFWVSMNPILEKVLNSEQEISTEAEVERGKEYQWNLINTFSTFSTSTSKCLFDIITW